MFVVLTGAASAAVTTQTQFLDSREASNDGAAGPIATSDVLPANGLYVAVVNGTYSKHPVNDWRPPNVICGPSEAQPIFPSPGAPNSRVGLDADTYFARWQVNRCRLTFPRHGVGFQINTGSGFAHREPIGGPFGSPTADHTYKYALIGAGAPASYRILDKPTSDNSGRLRIETRLATAADCANGGFGGWGFPDEATCVAALTPPGGGGGGGATPLPSSDNPPAEGENGPIGGRLVVSRRAIKLGRRGTVAVRVSCRSPLSCVGTLDLATVGNVRYKGKRRRLTLAKTIKFDVAPRTKNLVLRFRMIPAKQRVVNSQRRLRVRAIGKSLVGNPAKASESSRQLWLYRISPKPPFATS